MGHPAQCSKSKWGLVSTCNDVSEPDGGQRRERKVKGVHVGPVFKEGEDGGRQEEEDDQSGQQVAEGGEEDPQGVFLVPVHLVEEFQQVIAQVVTGGMDQDPGQWYSERGEEDAKDFTRIRHGRYVAVTLIRVFNFFFTF